MFIPLHDQNGLRHVSFQYVTVGLIALNALVFVLFQGGADNVISDAQPVSFGLIPSVYLDTAILPSGYLELPDWATLVSYMFLHGDWLHLIGNMLFLWVFGDNVEDATGHVRFLVFYLLCGVAAGLAHVYVLPGSDSPLIGASGAVSGVVAAYLMLHPRVRIWILVLWRVPLRLTALWVLGAWIVIQVGSAFLFADDVVAWWAHVGGIVAGAVLIPFFKRRGVPLFDRGLPA